MPDAPTTPALVVLWDGTDHAPWGRYLADDLRDPPAAEAEAVPAPVAAAPTRQPVTNRAAAARVWGLLKAALAARAGRPATAFELAEEAGVSVAVTHAALSYRVRAGHVAVAGEAPRATSFGHATVRAFVLPSGGDRAG